jgi:hypothetical protein
MISKFGLIELRTANKKKSPYSIPIRHNEKQILFTFCNSPHHTVVRRLKRGRSAIFPHGSATSNVVRGGAAGGANISSVGKSRRRRQRDIGPLHGITVEERNLHTTRVFMQHGFPPVCSELPAPYSSRKEHRKTESCATKKEKRKKKKKVKNEAEERCEKGKNAYSFYWIQRRSRQDEVQKEQQRSVRSESKQQHSSTYSRAGHGISKETQFPGGNRDMYNVKLILNMTLIFAYVINWC